MGERSIWEISVLSFQFCYATKNTPKIVFKSNNKRGKERRKAEAIGRKREKGEDEVGGG